MSELKLTGTIKLVKDTVQVTEKFSKREFVVTDSDALYPQYIMFQSCQDKCSMLDGYNVGDNVDVSFNLRGREWVSPTNEVKYFNTLDCWRIEKSGGIAGQYTQTPEPENMNTTISTNAEKDDFSF